MKPQKTGIFGLFAVFFMLAFSACQGPVNPENGEKTATGSINGKAYYENSDNHAGIAITLEKTDGLRSQEARSITARAQTDTDGYYVIANVEPGTYTVYASSPDSRQRAIAVNNVTIEAGRSVTAADLMLTATGSITGLVSIDATRYYYSATNPSTANTHWRWVDEVPTIGGSTYGQRGR